MTIGIVDAIKAIRDGDYKEIAEKYGCTTTEIILAAQERAISIMKFAIPNKADTCKEEDGKIHMHCPSCEADITDWNDDWGFCPYCGQAIWMTEGKDE